MAACSRARLGAGSSVMVSIGSARGSPRPVVEPSWRPVVADPPSGDRPEQHENGRFSRQDENSTPATGDGLADSEQTLADSEQTLADSDQSLADADHASGERDQTLADTDQDASDRDQAASDRDLGHGVDPEAHEVSRDIRQRTTRKREQTASARLQSASERDATAHTRDVAARARDHAATARDLAMAHQDAKYDHDAECAVSGVEIIRRAAEQRRCAAQHRTQAAEHRAQAAVDREAAADDRQRGARDRLRALADRESLAQALAATENDPLTGARARVAGLADLDHELDRCHRISSPLVVVYVDAVGLKAINDSEGHETGDELLKRVVTLIREHLRTYDLIIRVAGDEFLCAMSNMTLSDARERFSEVAAALAASSHAGAIRTGFAELQRDETASELIARADSQLLDSRRD